MKVDLSEEEKETLDRKNPLRKLGEHPALTTLLYPGRKIRWSVCDKEWKPQKDRRV